MSVSVLTPLCVSFCECARVRARMGAGLEWGDGPAGPASRAEGSGVRKDLLAGILGTRPPHGRWTEGRKRQLLAPSPKALWEGIRRPLYFRFGRD